MLLNTLKSRKKELGYTNRYIAQLSGVPKSTVDKIFSGRTASPRRETLCAIKTVLYTRTAPADQVREAEAAYHLSCTESADRPAWMTKPDGEYTVDDYMNFPEDVRAELIDGHVFILESPTHIHQHVAAAVYSVLRRNILEKKSRCVPFLAPSDVMPSSADNKTIVQPDVFVVCDRSKLSGGKRTVGAPDLVIEVLSPSTRKKNLTLKLSKYVETGVREYWIIDPEREQVLVYLIEKDCEIHLYGFDDQVPVGISGGELVIDFARLKEEISFFMA